MESGWQLEVFQLDHDQRGSCGKNEDSLFLTSIDKSGFRVARTMVRLDITTRVPSLRGPGKPLPTFATVSIILGLVLCHAASARIGETLDQVIKRYGQCLTTVKADNGLVYKLFNKSGYKILVHFYQGKVDEISYGKGTDIFDDELKALMQDNAPGQWVGSGWPVYRWHNALGINAHYSFEHRLLIIMTDSALEREKKGIKDALN
jgi:hypothetical protein